MTPSTIEVCVTDKIKSKFKSNKEENEQKKENKCDLITRLFCFQNDFRMHILCGNSILQKTDRKGVGMNVRVK